MKTKELNYRGITIMMRYYPDTPYIDAGWHWQCFKDGVCIADSYEDYPYPEARALELAKEAYEN